MDALAYRDEVSALIAILLSLEAGIYAKRLAWVDT